MNHFLSLRLVEVGVLNPVKSENYESGQVERK
jgi:hypothetical protein